MGSRASPAVHGRSVWDHFADHPDEERLFATFMRNVTLLDAPLVVGGYPWPEGATVCDVAGGAGTLLAALLSDRSDLRGVLFEARGVLEEADRHLRAAGVRDRVELREGDIGFAPRAD